MATKICLLNQLLRLIFHFVAIDDWRSKNRAETYTRLGTVPQRVIRSIGLLLITVFAVALKGLP